MNNTVNENSKEFLKNLTAIAFFAPGTDKRPRKYRGIPDKAKFEAFLRRTGLAYVNYYFKDSGEFWRQEIL